MTLVGRNKCSEQFCTNGFEILTNYFKHGRCTCDGGHDHYPLFIIFLISTTPLILERLHS